MSGHLITLVFLLVCVVSAQSKVHFYITPSLDIPCPKDPCLTLSQLAADSSNYTGHVFLVFLPGNHTLNRELILSGADNFSIESLDNEMVMIECQSHHERLIVNETTFAAIKRLHFVGCGGNTVTSVDELTVEHTIFQGVEGEGRDTALVLNEVNFTKIIECSFIFNTPGVHSKRHRVGKFIRDPSVLYILGLGEDDHVSVGGALLTTSSNVSVTNTKFVCNEAGMGGVLFAYKSIITVSRCRHSYNRAVHGGGVIATFEASVDISNSTFRKNVATHEDSSNGAVILQLMDHSTLLVALSITIVLPMVESCLHQMGRSTLLLTVFIKTMPWSHLVDHLRLLATRLITMQPRMVESCTQTMDHSTLLIALL